MVLAEQRQAQIVPLLVTEVAQGVVRKELSHVKEGQESVTCRMCAEMDNAGIGRWRAWEVLRW